MQRLLLLMLLMLPLSIDARIRLDRSIDRSTASINAS
jgi:hypothetical protein